MNAFQIAELCYTVKRNGITLRSYPKILNIKADEQRTQYVFKLPAGVNPTELKKKDYVFKQTLSPNIELDEDDNIYVITEWHFVKNDEFVYNYEELQKHLKTMTVKKKKIPIHLPIIAGMDKTGKIYVFDMVKTPHILMGGETGGGKSTILRAINTTLILYKKHIKNGLQLKLVDFKWTEFEMFRKIPDVTVIDDKNTLQKELNQIEKEIKSRKQILRDLELTHIDHYNEKEGAVQKPYIVMVIDEFHELQKDEDVFEKLHLISAEGRALGVYLIMATQRPSSIVIDGDTKSNLTVRFGLAHTGKISSRITMDDNNVDCSKITKEGEFYYKNLKHHKKIELLQGPYLTEDEAKALIEPFKVEVEQREPSEDENIIDMEGEERENVEPIETVQIGLLEGGVDE